MTIKVGVVGATGYAGAELVRLINAHPNAEVAAVSSVSFEGKKLSEVYPAYLGINDMICENADAVVEKVKDSTSSDSTASSDPTVTIDYESNTIYVE